MVSLPDLCIGGGPTLSNKSKTWKSLLRLAFSWN